MTQQETAIYNSGWRVGLAVDDYRDEIEDFGPLKDADAARVELVTAINAKNAVQNSETGSATTGKEEAREQMAQATAILSARAVGYALAIGKLDLKQAFTLTYTDVRFGEADEDVQHVRELVARVQALPQQVRTSYRLTPEVIQAPLTAATLFEQTEDTQTTAKAAPRLATLALPELVRRLSAALLLMQTLIRGQRNDPDPRWAELYAAFQQANKRHKEPGKYRVEPMGRPRIVRTLPLHAADGQPRRLANTNYGLTYTLTVENRAAVPLQLWMAQKDGTPTTPHRFPAGQVTTVTRAALGPETARYLTAQFEGEAGGEARVVVRRAQ